MYVDWKRHMHALCGQVTMAENVARDLFDELGGEMGTHDWFWASVRCSVAHLVATYAAQHLAVKRVQAWAWDEYKHVEIRARAKNNYAAAVSPDSHFLGVTGQKIEVIFLSKLDYERWAVECRQPDHGDNGPPHQMWGTSG